MVLCRLEQAEHAHEETLRVYMQLSREHKAVCAQQDDLYAQLAQVLAEQPDAEHDTFSQVGTLYILHGSVHPAWPLLRLCHQPSCQQSCMAFAISVVSEHGGPISRCVHSVPSLWLCSNCSAVDTTPVYYPMHIFSTLACSDVGTTLQTCSNLDMHEWKGMQ